MKAQYSHHQLSNRLRPKERTRKPAEVIKVHLSQMTAGDKLCSFRWQSSLLVVSVKNYLKGET